MKILKVIHGYPPRYNAGSEVYSQTLVHGLVTAGHRVEVFSRYENSFGSDCSMHTESDSEFSEVPLQLVNVARSKDRYQHSEIDRLFGQRLERFQPDIVHIVHIVHIGHLNHLSTSLVFEARRRQIPIVYTLHDYPVTGPPPPRLCRGDSNSLTFPGVHLGHSDREPPSTRQAFRPNHKTT